MFNQLTKYLLQYKRVSIPNVGTILLVQQPPQLDVADKTIQPPTYTAELRDDETVSEHQLNFLSAIMRQEKESIHHSLNSLGLWLREKVRGNGFEWKGIGIIRAPGHPLSLPVGILETIPAQRVLRQDAEHSVLVGDQQLTSTQIAGRKAEEETARGTKRSIFVIVGWILLALSILYIIFVLYQGRFRIGATGSKASPTGYQRLQVDNKYTVTIAGL